MDEVDVQDLSKKIEEPDAQDLSKKYFEIDRKMQETIKLTQDALKLGEDDESDIFKEYMKQKQHEYQLKKLQNSEIETLKSSSGNSSLASESHEDMFNLAVNLNTDNQKHVKFKIDSRTRSNSSERPSRRKVVKCRGPLLETMNNEFGLIKGSLAQSLDLESDKINRFMNFMYNEDLEDAEAMMAESIHKLKKKAELTNELYLNAHDPKKAFKSNLKPSESSKSKGVLLPRSRSLVKMKKKRSSSLTSLNTSHLEQKRWNSAVRRSLAISKDPAKKFYSRYVIGEDGILNCLLQEFPYLYTAPETIHYLWSRHAKQIETLTKSQRELESMYLDKNPDAISAKKYFLFMYFK